MKRKTRFFKLLIPILAVTIIAFLIIFFSQKIQTTSEAQDNLEEQQLIVSKDMRSAFTENEKKNLLVEFRNLRTNEEQFCGTVAEINKSAELSKTSKIKILQLENTCKTLMILSNELKNELNNPAESADEKTAMLIGMAITLPELSQNIKNPDLKNKELSKNIDRLNAHANTLNNNAKSFQNIFLNAIKIDITNPEPQLSENELNTIKGLYSRGQINGTEYDSKKFFDNIKSATKELIEKAR